MIRLIVTDVDGTLVPDGTTEINPEIFDVIDRLHAAGTQIAVASGREWESVEWLFRPVMTKIFYVADNGAYVGMHGRKLFIHTLNPVHAAEMIRLIRENPRLTAVGSDENGYLLEENNPALIDWLQNGYHTACRIVGDLTQARNLLKVTAYDPACRVTENGAGILAAMQGKLQVNSAGTMWLDANEIGVSKGEAVGVLQEALSIGPEETMVFGDQMNDISMLQKAKYSFAVANAVPEVKKAARFGADRNVDDGVLKILKCLL